MSRLLKTSLALLVLIVSAAAPAAAQLASGTISGQVVDEREGALQNATVTARHVETGNTRTAQTDGEGRYRFENIATGSYELTVEAQNFAKYVQTGINLLVNQNAVINVQMKAGGIQEVVTVTTDASVLNTSNAEVSTRFDGRRVSELPLAPNRNVFNVALGAPGVSQLGAGQTGFANGLSYSSNGGRVPSTHFMIGEQDTNDPSASGGPHDIHHPDSEQEVGLITNQSHHEFGRTYGP
jgi:hypothetical protein